MLHQHSHPIVGPSIPRRPCFWTKWFVPVNWQQKKSQGEKSNPHRAAGREGGHASRSLKKISPSGARAASLLFRTAPQPQHLWDRDQEEEAAGREKSKEVNPTSAGKLRIFFDTQTQLCALWGSPSALGISLDVGLELHQIGLERAWKEREVINVYLSLHLEKGNVQFLVISYTIIFNLWPSLMVQVLHTLLCVSCLPPRPFNIHLYLVPKRSSPLGRSMHAGGH